MRKYKIAGFIVGVESRYERTYRQAEPYRVSDDAETDFCMSLREETIETEFARGYESRDDAEYSYMRFLFQYYLMRRDGLVLHSSAVVYDGRAYLFSADSGTGKSTHTQLWIERFGADKAFILNDDAPALRRIDGKWFAYGTPWSGSSPLNANAQAPLQGIAFLERSETNWIDRINPDEATPKFLKQALQSLPPKMLGRMIDNTIALLKDVPVFKLGCNMTLDAPLVAYEAMSAATADRS